MKMTYLYHHLPKCGGVSFINACIQWFPNVRETTGSYPTKEATASFAKTRLDFDTLPDNCFVHGHLVRPGIRPFERYGDYIAAGRCRLVTIVRNPLERIISSYFHRRRVGREWPEPIEDWLTRGRNQLAKYLDITPETMRERLDNYFLIGTTESLQLTTELFANLTGNVAPIVPHLNISPRTDFELSDEAVKAFERRNQLDYEIYRYAVERLQRDARAHHLV